MGGASHSPSSTEEGWDLLDDDETHSEHPAYMASLDKSLSSSSSTADLEHLQSIQGETADQELAVVPNLSEEPFTGASSDFFVQQQKSPLRDVLETNSGISSSVESTVCPDDDEFVAVPESSAACNEFRGRSSFSVEPTICRDDDELVAIPSAASDDAEGTFRGCSSFCCESTIRRDDDEFLAVPSAACDDAEGTFRGCSSFFLVVQAAGRFGDNPKNTSGSSNLQDIFDNFNPQNTSGSSNPQNIPDNFNPQNMPGSSNPQNISHSFNPQHIPSSSDSQNICPSSGLDDHELLLAASYGVEHSDSVRCSLDCTEKVVVVTSTDADHDRKCESNVSVNDTCVQSASVGRVVGNYEPVGGATMGESANSALWNMRTQERQANVGTALRIFAVAPGQAEGGEEGQERDRKDAKRSGSKKGEAREGIWARVRFASTDVKKAKKGDDMGSRQDDSVAAAGPSEEPGASKGGKKRKAGQGVKGSAAVGGKSRGEGPGEDLVNVHMRAQSADSVPEERSAGDERKTGKEKKKERENVRPNIQPVVQPAVLDSAGPQSESSRGAVVPSSSTASAATRSKKVKEVSGNSSRKVREAERKVAKWLKKLGELGGSVVDFDGSSRYLWAYGQGIGSSTATLLRKAVHSTTSRYSPRHLILLLFFSFVAHITLTGLSPSNTHMDATSGLNSGALRNEIAGVRKEIAELRAEVSGQLRAVLEEMARGRATVQGSSFEEKAVWSTEREKGRGEGEGKLGQDDRPEMAWARRGLEGLMAKEKARGRRLGRETGREEGNVVGQDHRPEVAGQLRAEWDDLGSLKDRLRDLLAEKQGPVAGAGVEQTRGDMVSASQKRGGEGAGHIDDDVGGGGGDDDGAVRYEEQGVREDGVKKGLEGKEVAKGLGGDLEEDVVDRIGDVVTRKIEQKAAAKSARPLHSQPGGGDFRNSDGKDGFSQELEMMEAVLSLALGGHVGRAAAKAVGKAVEWAWIGQAAAGGDESVAWADKVLQKARLDLEAAVRSIGALTKGTDAASGEASLEGSGDAAPAVEASVGPSGGAEAAGEAATGRFSGAEASAEASGENSGWAGILRAPRGVLNMVLGSHDGEDGGSTEASAEGAHEVSGETEGPVQSGYGCGPAYLKQNDLLAVLGFVSGEEESGPAAETSEGIILFSLSSERSGGAEAAADAPSAGAGDAEVAQGGQEEQVVTGPVSTSKEAEDGQTPLGSKVTEDVGNVLGLVSATKDLLGPAATLAGKVLTDLVSASVDLLAPAVNLAGEVMEELASITSKADDAPAKVKSSASASKANKAQQVWLDACGATKDLFSEAANEVARLAKKLTGTASESESESESGRPIASSGAESASDVARISSLVKAKQGLADAAGAAKDLMAAAATETARVSNQLIRTAWRISSSAENAVRSVGEATSGPVRKAKRALVDVFGSAKDLVFAPANLAVRVIKRVTGTVSRDSSKTAGSAPESLNDLGRTAVIGNTNQGLVDSQGRSPPHAVEARVDQDRVAMAAQDSSGGTAQSVEVNLQPAAEPDGVRESESESVSVAQSDPVPTGAAAEAQHGSTDTQRRSLPNPVEAEPFPKPEGFAESESESAAVLDLEARYRRALLAFVERARGQAREKMQQLLAQAMSEPDHSRSESESDAPNSPTRAAVEPGVVPGPEAQHGPKLVALVELARDEALRTMQQLLALARLESVQRPVAGSDISESVSEATGVSSADEPGAAGGLGARSGLPWFAYLSSETEPASGMEEGEEDEHVVQVLGSDEEEGREVFGGGGDIGATGVAADMDEKRRAGKKSREEPIREEKEGRGGENERQNLERNKGKGQEHEEAKKDKSTEGARAKKGAEETGCKREREEKKHKGETKGGARETGERRGSEDKGKRSKEEAKARRKMEKGREKVDHSGSTGRVKGGGNKGHRAGLGRGAAFGGALKNMWAWAADPVAQVRRAEKVVREQMESAEELVRRKLKLNRT